MAGFSVAALTNKANSTNKKLSKQQKDMLKKYSSVSSPYEEKDTKKKQSAKPISNNYKEASNVSSKSEVKSIEPENISSLSSEKALDNNSDNILVSPKSSSLNVVSENHDNIKNGQEIGESNMVEKPFVATDSSSIDNSNIDFTESPIKESTYKAVKNEYTEQHNESVQSTDSESIKEERIINGSGNMIDVNSEILSKETPDLYSEASIESEDKPNSSSLLEIEKEISIENESVSEESILASEETASKAQDNIDTMVSKESIESKNLSNKDSVTPAIVSELSSDAGSNTIPTIDFEPGNKITVENEPEVESSVDSDVDSDNEDLEVGYSYGEADPSQFIYYHRKDIRLQLHTGEKRRQLMDSIRTSGIHEPILVRQAANGKFEIIAGHNRQDIARELGIKVPYFLIPNVNDDNADQICVDTNLLNRQHSEMLPSELSNMLAVKRKMFTLERLSEEFHIANTTMKSFLKLQDLLPELLYEWVDTKKIGMTAGYAIACADRDHQHDLLDYLNSNLIKSISVKQGKEITNRGKLPWDKDFLDNVFGRANSSSNQKIQTKVSLSFKELGKYLDNDELQDPKRALYNVLSLKKKTESILAANNMDYSEDIIIDALESYLYHNKRNL